MSWRLQVLRLRAAELRIRLLILDAQLAQAQACLTAVRTLGR